MELLDELGMTQAELARRTGRPQKTINEIIRGKASITPDTALQLQRVLGTPASYWNNRQQQYLEHQARVQERMSLSQQLDWLARFPVKAMVSMGWIRSFDDKVEQLVELLNFFGVASPEQWNVIWNQHVVAFRRTRAFESRQEDLSAWLRRGEIEAQEIYCQPYDAQAFRRVLNEIRGLTVHPPEVFCSELVSLCAKVGVAVVFIRQLPQARVSGATRWLTPDRALIQLSLRYKTDDHLWFTFFHEAGHILKHGKREIFLESETADQDKENEANDFAVLEGETVDEDKENEADSFAADMLIPAQQLNDFLAQICSIRYPSTETIMQFASKIGIAPSIVVGRLQHDRRVPHTHYNKLKGKLEWAEED